MFRSALYNGEPVFDDSNFPGAEDVIIDGERKTRGLIPRDRSIPTPYMQPFDLPLIPRDEWAQRIEEMEKTKSRLSDLCISAGLKCLDQNGTNYCWANATVHCVEILRVASGQPLVYLSPASVAAPIKNFANVGGWGSQALEYIIKNGIAPVELWPANSRVRSLDNDECRLRRKDFLVTEWYDLGDRNFDQTMTCLLLRIPVSAGYNWWGHQVTLVDPMIGKDGKFAVRARNSWGMSYGNMGFFVLTGSKMIPDDGCAPRVTLPGG
jgi:hypothetical protein